jgi:O-methyltransferase/methyltransferase family protein
MGMNDEARYALTPEQFQTLNRLIGGYRVSRAIAVVVGLGIPDLLASGPRTIDDLAQATETHASALYRVLRLLAGMDLFEETAPRQFRLTPLGHGLRSDVPGSMGSTALMHLDSARWRSWDDLLYSVRTGEIAFPRVHGVEIFDYMREHPDAAEVFQQAMTANTARSGAAITQVYDFSSVERIVDVGGGHGLFLARILQAYPALHGVLFDQPEVVKGASKILTAAGVADRCALVGGDFFAEVPQGGDIYLLRQIIHDWDDERAMLILANCRRAMAPSGNVLVIEAAISDDYQQSAPVLQLDLEMLVNYGGRQRTEDEYRALFTAAGLKLGKIIPLGDPGQFSVFAALPA